MGKRQAIRKKTLKVDDAKVKSWLDQILKDFHHRDFLHTDPISFPHSYTNSSDRELTAFIAALFSFGNVKAIKFTVAAILERLGSSPTQTLMAMSDKDLLLAWDNLYYRFYRKADILFLLGGLRDLILQHGTIGDFLKKSWTQHENIFSLIKDLRLEFLKNWPKEKPLSNGVRFMFADPHAGAAKRWHMLMRWMVRKDKIDFGIWNFIPTSALIQPLDVHLFEICRLLKLTRLKTPTRKAALEITEHFRRWDAQDPIKYDFALCRIGMLGLREIKTQLLLNA